MIWSLSTLLQLSLQRKEFDIWSDHKNLSWLMTKQNLNQHQARWATELTEYHFKLYYCKRSSMSQPDALSRWLGWKGEIEHDNTDQILLPIHKFADLQALSGTIRGAQSRCLHSLVFWLSQVQPPSHCQFWSSASLCLLPQHILALHIVFLVGFRPQICPLIKILPPTPEPNQHFP